MTKEERYTGDAADQQLPEEELEEELPDEELYDELAGEEPDGELDGEPDEEPYEELTDEAPAEEPEPEEEEEEAPYDPHKDTYEWFHCIIAAVIVCVLLFVLAARVIDVQGTSMEPTLHGGDKLVITRLAGGYEYGDIVVLQKDSFKREPIVKRVIGTAGQTITIDFKTGTVYLDGKALDEPYTKERTYDRYKIMDPAYYDVYGIDPEKDVTADTVTVTVPEGCVFVMGDNRNNSSDSREARINFVDTRIIMGKAVFRLFPFNRLGAIYGAELTVDESQSLEPEATEAPQEQATPAPTAAAQTQQEQEQTVQVHGSSMEPTLLNMDELSITPQDSYVTGDIVALRKTGYSQEAIVKRVIAAEGQTLTIDFLDGTVTVDGEVLDEPYITEPAYDTYDILDPSFYEIYGIDPEKDVTEDSVTVTVPEDSLFVLGDNRNNSSDSRASAIGYVTLDEVIGKATACVAPADRAGPIYGTVESNG